MSTLTVSYRDLGRASSDANTVAKRIGDYSNSLQREVVKKLNNYSGTWTGNMNSAKSQTEQKINDLNEEKRKYEKLSTDLSDLCEECKSTDVAVKGLVSSLTADFKQAHGIRNNPVENAIMNFLTSLQNCTFVDRWVESKLEDFMDNASDLYDRIKYWYNYEGGKEDLSAALTFIAEIAVALLSFALAIATFMAAALTLGSLLVFLASATLATIGILDAIANLKNECRASSLRGKDPATAKRLSDLNTAADTFTSSFMYGDGEYYEYNEFYNNISSGLKIAKLVADIIKFVDGGLKLLTNLGKWLSGSEGFKLTKLFSKSGIKAFLTDVRKNIGDFKRSFHIDFSSLRSLGEDIWKNSLNNLKNEFLDFENLEDSFSSMKKIASFGKDIIGMIDEGKFDFKKIYEDVIGPGLGIADIPNKENKHKMITIGYFTSLISKVSKMLEVPGELSGTTIDVKCLDKLNDRSTVSIEIKPVRVPQFSF